MEGLRRLVAEIGLADDDGLSVARPVVQAMAPPGVALIITSREDAAFGPIVSLGLDGIPSELLGDTVYRVPPLTTVDAAAMVRELRPPLRCWVATGRPESTLHGSRTCCTEWRSCPTQFRSLRR